ncbi:ABC transporter A family member 1 [Vitis vinifera]|uniref:ABC transporter A family member 1 n=1 Tax=Vitis vinifera TaxID=29760 RepID=A0A438C021_VITVI|nr:ABC transporter A family member 1 [Vitis vinifera]
MCTSDALFSPSDNFALAENFFRLSPGFCFADGLASLALLRQGMKGGSSDGVLDWNVTGASICYLGVEGKNVQLMELHLSWQRCMFKSKAARRHIGYCPQFDALLEYLTVQEHLELYARIKGVPGYRMQDVCTHEIYLLMLICPFQQTQSRWKQAQLSVAIAMVGDPPIVILDEPSTGMDPIAKRFMWEVISRLSTRRGKTAVILTTHSMAEAQALCTRIGIMVGGRLRCIGSSQHLKTRFGNHLELEVKPTEVSHVDLENLLAEISLSPEMIVMIGRWLGNEERISTLISSTPVSDGVFGEQLSEQLFRDDSNRLKKLLQLPYGYISLADVFGHLERNR